LLGIEVADPVLAPPAQALERAEHAAGPGLSGLHAPQAALHDLAVAEEIFRRDVAQQEHVVVEVDELVGEVVDAPEHGDDRAAVEGRQVPFEAAEDLAVVDHVEALGFRRAAQALEDGRGLRVGDDMDPAEPRREAQDGADAVVDLAGVVEPRAMRAGRARLAGSGKPGIETLPMRRV
jgi:hypothetical protein